MPCRQTRAQISIESPRRHDVHPLEGPIDADVGPVCDKLLGPQLRAPTFGNTVTYFLDVKSSRDFAHCVELMKAGQQQIESAI